VFPRQHRSIWSDRVAARIKSDHCFFLSASLRLFCAADIFLRASALIWRFGLTAVTTPVGAPWGKRALTGAFPVAVGSSPSAVIALSRRSRSAFNSLMICSLFT